MNVSHVQVPFNRADVSGNEELYLREVLRSNHFSGNGRFTKRCCGFFEEEYSIGKAFLTTSGTDALEMCALLLDLGPGDEVILPSFTFVSTANAFLLRGVDLVFADSCPHSPNIDLDHVERLLTERTRAVVVVHYGGVACDLDRLREIVAPYKVRIIEDAAHAVEAYYKGRRLGTIGDLGAFSFHETKNVMAGEGGLLAVNDGTFAQRAEILWEKGTNRSQFFRGEIDKYGWIDLGSSFLASEFCAAVLWAQLERLQTIQASRLKVWTTYDEVLRPRATSCQIEFLEMPWFASNNAHLFGLVCASLTHRTDLLRYLRSRGVYAAFHYQPLHSSPYFAHRYKGEPLPNADRFGDCLLRLPVYSGMTDEELGTVISALEGYSP